MRVIICGAGQVGWQIARHLSGERNDVTVVDNNPELVRRITDTLDVQGVAEVAGVPPYLAFAVQELLSNVEEFAAEGARVSITLRQEPKPSLEVSHASSVVAEAKFFEPYAVGPGQKRPGAGLGLFMVAQIAAAHGGTCEAIDAGPEAFAVRLTLKPAAA